MNVTFHKRSFDGFSLVELSIVLVILGLLVGGILGGQSLIRASELRSVTTQYESILSATNAFKDKYIMLPGDLSNATQFWGIAAGSGSDSTCADFVSTTTATCNGNGDGTIRNEINRPLESLRYWQHLANAGLINGQYSGTSPAGPTATTANSMQGKFNKSTWAADSEVEGSNPSASASWLNDVSFYVPYRNFLMLGKMKSFDTPTDPIMPPENAWNIDTKIDDGKPGKGKMLIVNTGIGGITTCTDAANGTDYDADYLLTASEPTCSIIFNEAY